MSRLIWAPLFIRAILSYTFIMHGVSKVMGGMAGINKYTSWLATLHIPIWLAYASIAAELLGGIAIGLGFATELTALILAVDMGFAIYLVHMKHGFFIQNNGYEYALCLLLLCVALIFSGPGKWYFAGPCLG